MEKVETLVQKLQDQWTKKSTARELLLTTQLLQQELSAVIQNLPAEAPSPVVVSIPMQIIPQPPAEPVAVADSPVKAAIENTTPAEEGKIIEILQIDEAEVEAELEELKKNAVTIQQFSVKSKPQLLFELDEEEIPTLALQPDSAKNNTPNVAPANELPDSPTLNDKLKEEKTEVGDQLNQSSIKDLKKAIGINDRFLYINELFRGDEAMYERSIKTINSFETWPEAEYWIRRELKTKLGWIDDDKTVQQFDHLIKRRFSRI